LAVRSWHVGKIVLLWAWGIALVVLALDVLRKVDNPFTGFGLIAGLIAIPIALSVLTWRWLGGKEH